MRIFVTGASGWIGSAVVPDLIAGGHEVVGLARSDASAEALSAAGAAVHRGNLDAIDGIRAAAEASDGVIHLAFNHEVAFAGGFDAAALTDRSVIEAIGEALADSDRPFVVASGLLGLAPSRVAVETDGLEPPTGGASGPSARHLNALITLAMAERGVRSSVLRLPPSVHGDGDNGFMATIIGFARDKGVSRYVGDGANRWPAVHRSDAARLIRLAVEAAPAGSALHVVGDEGVPIRDVATVIGKHLDLPVESIAPENVADHFSWMAGFIGLDSPASGAATQELLGWTPTGPTLLEDLDAGHYFRASSD